jgi:hypothetical protein
MDTKNLEKLLSTLDSGAGSACMPSSTSTEKQLAEDISFFAVTTALLKLEPQTEKENTLSPLDASEGSVSKTSLGMIFP